ncbi:ABC transporter permease [Flavitalea sp. BT771]|uniref:ABC transporter permease n=1 Tax=Flavitalea sp. BT771 TaxID=3063329 RepID=UPI0026E2FFAD|nr:ABC transporter permease [Flavitalea sp. BT771]MDO6430401.1 ABC transporter permease [Flavitalea sp. BT771]MDV6219459.1 ABC transporter permease [Flavitalea sp. BT771]
MNPNAMKRTWRETITPQKNIFSLDLKEIWNYRDLLFILVRRDILAIYKQTILGPLWFFLQPLLTTFTFVIVFARVGNLYHSDFPPLLFYLSGLVLWAYFSECVLRTSTFLRDNNPILSKVYFPRLIVPLSLILTNLVKLFIQLIVFLLVYTYFLIKTPTVRPNAYALLFPLLILLIAGLGLGAGMIISSLTTRYKDLSHLTTFGVQLLMFVSPVILPMSSYGNGSYRLLILANPMTGIIEAFRYGFSGQGYFSWALLGYDTACVILFMSLGILTFNAVEKNFIDSI